MIGIILLAFPIIFLLTERSHNLNRTIYHGVVSYTMVLVYHKKIIRFHWRSLPWSSRCSIYNTCQECKIVLVILLQCLVQLYGTSSFILSNCVKCWCNKFLYWQRLCVCMSVCVCVCVCQVHMQYEHAIKS